MHPMELVDIALQTLGMSLIEWCAIKETPTVRTFVHVVPVRCEHSDCWGLFAVYVGLN